MSNINSIRGQQSLLSFNLYSFFDLIDMLLLNNQKFIKIHILVFGFSDNNISRPDRTKDRVGIIIFLRKLHTIINKLFDEQYENITISLVSNKKILQILFSITTLIYRYLLHL